MSIQPFQLPYSPDAVQDLRDRLARTRWPGPAQAAGWEYGFDRAYLEEICRYWKEEFNWKAQIAKMSAFENYRYDASGLGIHFLHARSRNPAAIPLILTHGWPGSFLEMLKIVPMLTGAFHVVVPSLPGFGFSDRPVQPGMDTLRIAGLWVDLMHALGYERFGAQGGDFGASVTTYLGLRYPERIIGIHLNYIPGSYRPHLEPGAALTDVERAFLDGADRWNAESGAYSHLQRNEPLTAAYGLNDSPAALAAWILDKFRLWAADFEGAFTRDDLLANVTLYWMTETIYSSFRLYYETRLAPVHFQAGERVQVPCAIARFPMEAPFPPREWVERGYDVLRWTGMPKGGHFAAEEEPELLAADILAFFQGLKSGG